jgi:protein-S-isoprenylcysteine O-methyltransferase Ste14
MAQADTPGVAVPPPLLYAGGFVVGLALDWLLPLGRLQRTRWLMAVGIVLIVLTLILGISAFRAMRRAGTNINPYKPTTNMVTSFPFGLTRNPIYLSMTLLYLGLVILLGTVWPLCLLVPVLVVMQRGVIVREEQYLESKFGGAYRRYRERVRRWF